MINRRKTKKVSIGSVSIGGDSKITVQSMANTDTRNPDSTVEQISHLQDTGCDIVRVAVPDMEAANALPSIIKRIKIPLVADIHFDYRLALKAMNAGVNGLRLNPGNIKDPDQIKTVVNKAKEQGIPIRVGANSGSLSKDWFSGIDMSLTHEQRVANAMVIGVQNQIKILENLGFEDIVISLKSSDVLTCITAYKLMAQKCNYPFHLGITEAGPITQGTVKSSIGLGILLYEGIGDTIRVSLTDSPLNEVRIGHIILQSLGLRREYPEIISCPTCGRCRIQVIDIAKQVEEAISKIKCNVKVAVMGCEVNGPGEAREADIGIAGGMGYGIFFKKGEVIGRVTQDEIVSKLIQEVKHLSVKGDI